MDMYSLALKLTRKQKSLREVNKKNLDEIMTTQGMVRLLCDSLPARLPVLHIPIRTKLEHNLHLHVWSIQIWRLKKNEGALLHSWTDKMVALGSTITFHTHENSAFDAKLFETLRTTRKLHSEKNHVII